VLLRFGLAFPVLALPAAMMGGTLPALVRAVVRDRSRLHHGVGWLYGLNTAGGALGTLLAGIVLIEWIGLWRSVLLSASINLLVGLTVLWAFRGRGRGPLAREGGQPAEPGATAEGPALSLKLRAHLRQPTVLYCAIAVAITGLLSTVYEVVWARLLALVIGSSSYAFTLVLAVFLLGIAAGSLIYAASTKRRPPTAADLALLLLFLAISAWLSMALIPQMPQLLVRLAQAPDLSLARLLAFEALFVAAIVLLPALLFGATLPLAMGIVVRQIRQAGGDVGGVYLANTLGAIAGSMLAGFVLIPSFGSRTTLLIGLAINLLLAGAGLIAVVDRAARRYAGIAIVLLLAALPRLEWPPYVLNAGLAHRLDRLAAKTPLQLRQKLRHLPSRLLYQREGTNATVTVKQFRDSLSLLVNGKPDASTNTSDMQTQVLLGAVPLLAHRQPRQVGIIGWGSGVTVHVASLFAEVQQIDAIEIEPAVVEASDYFDRVNGKVRGQRRVRLVIDDARSHLLTEKRRYDVLISEPSNPWMSGVAALFSSDFYQLVKRRLNREGIFCQWLQLYRIDARTVALMFRTLLAAFPHVELWFADDGDALLLASKQPLIWSYERVERAYRGAPRLRLQMGAYGPGHHPAQLFGGFLLGRRDLRRLAAAHGQRINSDDHPLLEYRALRSLNRRVDRHLLSLLRAKHRSGRLLPRFVGRRPPDALALAGAARLLEGTPELGQRVTRWAVERHPSDPWVRVARARSLIANRQPGRALELLDPLPLEGEPRAAAILATAAALLDSGQVAEAARRLDQLGSARPTARLVYHLTAMIELERHDAAWSAAEKLLARGLDRPDEIEARRLQRHLLYQKIGRLTAASRQYRRAVRLLRSRTEPLGGELDRLVALLAAQRGAGLTVPAARTMDRLLQFGTSSLPVLELCVEVYRQAGQHARAEKCSELLDNLRSTPRQGRSSPVR
jgi:spermidine synthase